METKANYTLIGLFTLAVIVGAFGFVYWFQSIGGGGARSYYRVVFDGSVSGLTTGVPVLFNGIRVGEVTGLALDPQHPEFNSGLFFNQTTEVPRVVYAQVLFRL